MATERDHRYHGSRRNLISSYPVYLNWNLAAVAQLAEHLLPKQRVVGSNPISRSKMKLKILGIKAHLLFIMSLFKKLFELKIRQELGWVSRGLQNLRSWVRILPGVQITRLSKWKDALKTKGVAWQVRSIGLLQKALRA